MIQALALLASACVALSYLHMVRKGKQKQFNVVNALCAPPIAVAQVLVGAYGPLALTVFFGCVGAWGWWRAGTKLPGYPDSGKVRGV